MRLAKSARDLRASRLAPVPHPPALAVPQPRSAVLPPALSKRLGAWPRGHAAHRRARRRHRALRIPPRQAEGRASGSWSSSQLPGSWCWEPRGQGAVCGSLASRSCRRPSSCFQTAPVSSLSSESRHRIARSRCKGIQLEERSLSPDGSAAIDSKLSKGAFKMKRRWLAIAASGCALAVAPSTAFAGGIDGIAGQQVSQTQSADNENSTEQSASGQAGSYQANVNAPITIASPGSNNGDVNQGNNAENNASSKNNNSSDQ